MTRLLDKCADRLLEMGRKVRRSGDIKREAQCPAHEDRQASLSITEGEDGRLLLFCHAGCTTENILKAMGWEPADLFPPKVNGHHHNGYAKRTLKAWPTIEGAIEASRLSVAKKLELPQSEVVYAAHWIYTDADGAAVAAVVRFDLPTTKDRKREKTFRPLQRISAGWSIGDPANKWPLYRLPQLAGIDRVYVCEGEKAADAAAQIGLVATTSAHGAKSADGTDWSPLASAKEIIIIPDHDQAGEKYAADVHAANAGSVVKIVRLAELAGDEFPIGGDIVDFLAEFRDGQEAAAVKAEIEAATERAPVLPAPQAKPEDSGIEAISVRLSDVKREMIRWLWRGRIALGKVTMFAGDPGLGKSLLTVDIAARISRGFKGPDFPSEADAPGSVIMLNCEDDLADTIAPRLHRAGADLEKVVAIKAVRSVESKRERSFSLEKDLAVLETELRKLPDPRAIIIDPLSAYLGEKDSNKNAEMRALLAPVSDLAAKYGVAIICVTHLNKGSGPAIYRTMGSLAFVAFARTAWAVTKDKDDPTGERRLMLPIKNNLAKDEGGLAFRIAGGAGEVCCVSWEEGVVVTTADSALSSEPEDQDEGQTEVDRACDWLKVALADGPVGGKDIIKQAKEAGFSERTLNRAKARINVEAFRPRNPGPWFWRLQEHTAKHTASSPTTLLQWQCGNVTQTPPNNNDFSCSREQSAKGKGVVGGVTGGAE